MRLLRIFVWAAAVSAAGTAAVYGVLQIGNVPAEIVLGAVAVLLVFFAGLIALGGPGGASRGTARARRSVPAPRQVPYWLQVTSIIVGMATGIGSMVIALFKG